MRLHEDAKTTANVSNVGLAVGGAAVIGGVVLFLTAPAGEAAAPAPGARGRVLPVVGMGSTGVLLQGVW